MFLNIDFKDRSGSQQFYYHKEFNVLPENLSKLHKEGDQLSKDDRKEALLKEIEIMEKEIVYLKGRIRRKARKAYLNLLESSISTLGLDNPIYLLRYE